VKVDIENASKPCNNDPFNNEILSITNLVLSPFVVDYTMNRPCDNKKPSIKNEIRDISYL
jgi:hypothetical protein